MEDALAKELSGRDPATVRELILDNIVKTTHLAGLDGRFAELRSLSLINVGLTSLEGFPHLPKLRRVRGRRPRDIRPSGGHAYNVIGTTIRAGPGWGYVGGSLVTVGRQQDCRRPGGARGRAARSAHHARPEQQPDIPASHARAVGTVLLLWTGRCGCGDCRRQY